MFISAYPSHRANILFISDILAHTVLNILFINARINRITKSQFKENRKHVIFLLESAYKMLLPHTG